MFIILLFIYFDFQRLYFLSPLIPYNINFVQRRLTEHTAFEGYIPCTGLGFTVLYLCKIENSVILIQISTEQNISQFVGVSLVVRVL
jgi:hypothetical protein